MDSARLPSKLSLLETAKYFLRKLQPEDAALAEKLAHFLNRKAVNIATGCSGLDGPVDAVRALFKAFEEMYHVKIVVNHILSVEKSPGKLRSAYLYNIVMRTRTCGDGDGDGD